MFGLLISIFTFIATLPFKVSKGVVKGVKSVKDKVNEVKDKGVVESSKKAIKSVANFSRKVAKVSISLFIKLIRITVTVVGLVSPFVAIFTLICFLYISSSVGSLILLFSNNDELSSQLHNKVTTGSSEGIGIEAIDSSSNVGKCEALAKWYIANVHTYQGLGKNKRRYYHLTLEDANKYHDEVGDDCTAFACAYASWVSKKKIADEGTSTMVYSDSSLSEAGWTYIDATKITVDDLVPGDILVRNSAVKGSTGHHAEIYISKNSSFGWGSVQSSFPSSKNKAKDASNGMIELGGQIYCTVWRYTGGN